MEMPKKTVWVVDDIHEMSSLFSDYLKAVGYSVETFSDGKTVIDKLNKLGKEHSVGAILSDICMKPVNGLEVLKQVHQIDPKLPVVLMSSLPISDSQIQQTGTTAFSFLQKPFLLSNLNSVMSRAVSSGGR